jgi:hypothetical protein
MKRGVHIVRPEGEGRVGTGTGTGSREQKFEKSTRILEYFLDPLDVGFTPTTSG